MPAKSKYFIKLFINTLDDDQKIEFLRLYEKSSDKEIIYSDKVEVGETLADSVRRFVDENFTNASVHTFSFDPSHVEYDSDKFGNQIPRYRVFLVINRKGEIAPKDQRFYIKYSGGDTQELRKDLNQYLSIELVTDEVYPEDKISADYPYQLKFLGYYKKLFKGFSHAIVVLYMIDEDADKETNPDMFVYVVYYYKDFEPISLMGVEEVRGRSIDQFLADLK